MKKYLITGLVILLPVTLTVIVVAFIVNLLTDPFVGMTKAFLKYYNLLQTGFFVFNAEQVQTIVSQILILVVLVSFTIFLGFIARWFFFYYMLRLWDYVIHRIPLVSSIYKVCQDVIQTIFASKSRAFKQVVMVRFPSKETHSLGLVTSESLESIQNALGGPERVVVFIPTTPNPTSGFLIMVPKNEVIPLDMRIEDALKYIISCGVIMTPFQKAESLYVAKPLTTDIAGL